MAGPQHDKLLALSAKLHRAPRVQQLAAMALPAVQRRPIAHQGVATSLSGEPMASQAGVIQSVPVRRSKRHEVRKKDFHTKLRSGETGKNLREERFRIARDRSLRSLLTRINTGIRPEWATLPEGSYGRERHDAAVGTSALVRRALARRGPVDANLDILHRPTEIDHGPNYSAYGRGQDRALDNEASALMPAVILPRDVHRRHPTTVGGRYLDDGFRTNQGQLIVRDGNYTEAMRLHFEETLTDRTLGNTGPANTRLIVAGMRKAVNYAAQPIPVSLHDHHEAGTPLITEAQQNGLLAFLAAKEGRVLPRRDGVN